MPTITGQITAIISRLNAHLADISESPRLVDEVSELIRKIGTVYLSLLDNISSAGDAVVVMEELKDKRQVLVSFIEQIDMLISRLEDGVEQNIPPIGGV